MSSTAASCDFPFQPSLPLRGAMARANDPGFKVGISTLAPLAGSDAVEHVAEELAHISTLAPLAGSDEHQTRAVLEHLRISTLAPLARSDSRWRSRRLSGGHFNPRSPCGERPPRPQQPGRSLLISTLAPLAGSDALRRSRASGASGFQPSLPLRGATRRHRAPRARRGISTLAPLAGSDHTIALLGYLFFDFNPRSPCGERPHWMCEACRDQGFQPSLPLRGATEAQVKRRDGEWISTLAPLAGSDIPDVLNHYIDPISTLAPLAGSDTISSCCTPTECISTLAPLAGSDFRLNGFDLYALDFNPRSPCGERLHVVGLSHIAVFISTLAPLAGSDCFSSLYLSVAKTFQPSLPLRGATAIYCNGCTVNCQMFRFARFSALYYLYSPVKVHMK